PLPAGVPGEIVAVLFDLFRAKHVSIRSGLVCREKSAFVLSTDIGIVVSIRSRLVCREKSRFPLGTQRAVKFQSAPGWCAGRNMLLRRIIPKLNVSIRSRLVCREKSHLFPGRTTMFEFQSAPGWCAGRNKVRLGSLVRDSLVSIRSRLV